jgi:hypothetical protein
METVLFVPKVPAAPAKRGLAWSSKGWLLLGGVLAAGLLLVFFVSTPRDSQSRPAAPTAEQQSATNNASQASPTPSSQPAIAQITNRHVEPVTGAFGWNLGDRLPDNLTARQNEKSFGWSFFSMDPPPTPTPYFKMFRLEVTRDRRICRIIADGVLEEPNKWLEVAGGLDAVLYDKYGRTRTNHYKLGDHSFRTYFYGGNGREARLEVEANLEGSPSSPSPFARVGLDYTDTALCDIAEAEKAEAKKAAAEATKKAAKSAL